MYVSCRSIVSLFFISIIIFLYFTQKSCWSNTVASVTILELEIHCIANDIFRTIYRWMRYITFSCLQFYITLHTSWVSKYGWFFVRVCMCVYLILCVHTFMMSENSAQNCISVTMTWHKYCSTIVVVTSQRNSWTFFQSPILVFHLDDPTVGSL